MNIPGFSAEAALGWAMEVYRTLPRGDQTLRARVSPQAKPGASLTFETTGCNFSICTLQFYEDAPPTWSCTPPQNICAHPTGASL
jgi:hypothetical protein